jgi:hypothetical protein
MMVSMVADPSQTSSEKSKQPQPRHHIHAACREQCQRDKVAEGPVSDQDVTLVEVAPELLCQRDVLRRIPGGGEVHRGTAAQTEKSEHLHDGETAAPGLCRGLWKATLVPRCVGQAEGGAVDDADIPALEQVQTGCAVAGRLFGVVERLVQEGGGEASSSP